MNHGECVKTNGQIAYEAFCSAGRMIPEPWDMKDKFERAMWDAAAKAVAAAEREACAHAVERLISGDGICADDGVWIHDCADAIRERGDYD